MNAHEESELQRNQEAELYALALANEDAFENWEEILHDAVSEEDEDQDLERSVLQAEKTASKKGWKVWAFPLDDRIDNSSLWGIMIGPDFDTVKKKLQDAIEKTSKS